MSSALGMARTSTSISILSAGGRCLAFGRAEAGEGKAESNSEGGEASMWNGGKRWFTLLFWVAILFGIAVVAKLHAIS